MVCGLIACCVFAADRTTSSSTSTAVKAQNSNTTSSSSNSSSSGKVPPASSTAAAMAAVSTSNGKASEAQDKGGADGDVDDVAKKIKNLRKKLKQVGELKSRLEAGEELNADQRLKLAGEKELVEELAALEK